MTTSRRAAIVILIAFGFVSTAHAQIPCSFTHEMRNNSWQQGTDLWLEDDVQTWLTGLPCQIGAMVEASVNGVSGSGLRADGILSAAARRDVPVPYSSRWVTSGTHFRGTLFGELFVGNTTSSAQISYRARRRSTVRPIPAIPIAPRRC